MFKKTQDPKQRNMSEKPIPGGCRSSPIFRILKTWKISCTLSLFMLALFACAKQGALTGGLKDDAPPQIDSLKSTPNFATRFDGRRIELTFNEWVVLSEVGAQVVISPPLVKKTTPQVTLRGKTVSVELPEGEILRPNTTYTINFGTAVKDLHENNPAKNLRFVFSTGDFIDSLLVTGIVSDAFTQEPVENVSIMLYENTSDSVVRKEKPYYFAKTNKQGEYTIENVKPGAFKVAAIDDTGGDLKWDGQNERIGFIDTLLAISPGLKGLVNLKVFTNPKRTRLMDNNSKRYGLVKLTYQNMPDSLSVRALTDSLVYRTERNADTLYVWYDAPRASEPWSLVARETDTVKVKMPARAAFMAVHRPAFADDLPPAPVSAKSNKARGGIINQPAETPQPAATPPKRAPKTDNQNPGKPALLPFNVPIAAFDTSKWKIVADSADYPAFTLKPDSLSPRRLLLYAAWRPGKSHTLTLLPGAFTDLYGLSNTDTLARVFIVPDEKALGALNLTLQELTPGRAYVLEVLNGTNVEETLRIRAQTSEQKLKLAKLAPALFSLRLIEDRNNNGRWDTGDYFGHRQPEPIFSKKLEALRANWELDAVFSIGPEGNKRTGAEKKK
jgi:uncharacterized protein (DUF2141 family)